jgi:hypothetical protein
VSVVYCLSICGWLRFCSSIRSTGSAFHGEANFDRYLPVIHLAFVDVAARLDYLKPGKLLDGLLCAFNGRVDRLLDRSGRCAGELGAARSLAVARGG